METEKITLNDFIESYFLCEKCGSDVRIESNVTAVEKNTTSTDPEVGDDLVSCIEISCTNCGEYEKYFEIIVGEVLIR